MFYDRDLTLYHYNFPLLKQMWSLNDDTVFVNAAEAEAHYSNECHAFIHRIFNCDPSDRKIYTQWLINQYRKGYSESELYKLKPYLYIFDKFKHQLSQRDIYQYTPDTLQSVVNIIDQNKRSKRNIKKIIKTEGTDVIQQTSEFVILNLKTAEAAHLYGKNTKWCTNTSEYRITPLLKTGSLFLILCDNGMKIQIHIETGQMLDERGNDADANVLMFLYPSLTNFFEEYLLRYSLKNTDTAYNYCVYIRNCRVSTVEKFLIDKKDADCVTKYARNVIKGRWPEAESVILTDLSCIYNYALRTLQHRWLEGEYHIIKLLKKNRFNQLDSQIFNYIDEFIKHRWYEVETYIKKDACIAYDYATSYMKGGIWSEAEKYIKKQPFIALKYARFNLKRRWFEAEKYIVRDSTAAITYGRLFVKGKWPAYEDVIYDRPKAIVNYCVQVLKSRWKEREHVIYEHTPSAMDYAAHFKIDVSDMKPTSFFNKIKKMLTG